MKRIDLKTYMWILIALAAALTSSWIYWYGFTLDPRLIVGTVVFAIFILLGDVFPIYVDEQNVFSTWDIALIVSIAALGPTWAAIAALPSVLYTCRGNWLRTTYELSHTIIITYLAGMVLSSVSTPLLLSSTPEYSVLIIYGTFISSITLLVANKSINITLIKIKYGKDLFETWNEFVSPYLLSDAVNVLTATLGVLALTVYGPTAALIVIGGAISSQALVYRSRDQLRENRKLRERISSLEESLTISNLTFGAMMIRDLGRRDGYTDRHAAATSVYAADIARELHFDELRAERLGMAGLLHNIGMFSLPEEIVSATGQLNSVAWKELEKHPERGERALAAVPEFKEMASWVRWHHERLDGRGYPDKLREPWIPTEARILTVAQAYAAMVIDQPRRPGMSPAEAREQLSAGIDTEFDGSIVRAFLRILETESEGYRMADDYRFVFPAPGSERLPEGLRDASILEDST